jgi:hypothetical protein
MIGRCECKIELRWTLLEGGSWWVKIPFSRTANPHSLSSGPALLYPVHADIGPALIQGLPLAFGMLEVLLDVIAGPEKASKKALDRAYE